MPRAPRKSAPPAPPPEPSQAPPPVSASLLPLEGVIPYARNARTHSAEQIAQIVASIEEFGFVGSVVIRDGVLAAGHGRCAALRQLYEAGRDVYPAPGKAGGASPLPKGTVPVVDCTGWTDAQFRAYVIADNKLAMNADWADDILRIELESLKGTGLDDLTGFAKDELDLLFTSGEPSDEDIAKAYTSKIDTPIYTPKGERPEVSTLFDSTKADALAAAVQAADLPPDVEGFLLAAARRHTTFHYARIAEFYCHASPEVQRLMEDSALVIIDFQRAIELGYVQVSKRLNELFADAYPDGDANGDDDAAPV